MKKYELQNVNQSKFPLMFAPQDKETERGCIGYLRADFDRGKSFFSTWFDETPALKIQDFKNEFDEMINHFRESLSAPLLRSRSDMLKVGNELKPTVYDGDNEIHGFKVETPKYTYFLKCTPRQGDYDLYCYCYNTELLTQYLKTQSFKNEPANKQKDMDTKYIDLVASYEELLKVPQHEAATAYFGDLSLHYIKSKEAMDIACGIKHKALELLGMTQKEFDAKPEFVCRSKIKEALNECFERFQCISGCADKNYLFQKLSVSELHKVENVLQAYVEGKIDLYIPKNADTEEIDFDGDFDLIIKEASYDEIGMEVTVLKWYESLENTDYMVDVIQSESYSSHEILQDDIEQADDDMGGINME